MYGAVYRSWNLRWNIMSSFETDSLASPDQTSPAKPDQTSPASPDLTHPASLFETN